jgi:hypothetical protein
MLYNVRKVSGFSVPSRDVTNQTLPGRELLNYSRPGRVWLETSWLGTGKPLTFFPVYKQPLASLCTYFVLQCMNGHKIQKSNGINKFSLVSQLKVISIFFKNSRRYSQVKVHPWYQQHRWQICQRCQRHWIN